MYKWIGKVTFHEIYASVRMIFVIRFEWLKSSLYRQNYINIYSIVILKRKSAKYEMLKTPTYTFFLCYQFLLMSLYLDCLYIMLCLLFYINLKGVFMPGSAKHSVASAAVLTWFLALNNLSNVRILPDKNNVNMSLSLFLCFVFFKIMPY